MNKALFHWPPCIRLYDRSISICPRHPEMLWEVAKRSAANWRHGSSTPTVVLTEPPSLPAVDWLPLGLWLDGSIIILFLGYGEIGSCLIFWVGNEWLTTFHIARCFLASLGVPLHTLMLITITKRKYLANDYSVVKEPSRFRHTKENRWKGSDAPSPVCSLKKNSCSVKFKKSQNLFSTSQ